MRPSRRFITLALALGILGLCGLSAFILWGTAQAVVQRGGLRALRMGGQPGIEYSESKALELPDGRPQRLVVDTRFGNIHVHGGDALRAEVTRVARAATDAEAQAAARAIQVDVSLEAGTLRLVQRRREPRRIEGIFGDHWEEDRASFDVTVPAGVDVELRTQAGEMSVEELEGSAELEGNFGSVEARAVAGALKVSLDSGGIDVRDAGAEGADVELASRFGNVRAESIRGGLSVETDSGEVEVVGIRAGDRAVRVDDRFGNVSLRDVESAGLELSSDSGRAQVEEARVSGEVSLTVRFGDLRIDGLEAGSARIEQGTGQLDWTRGRVSGRLVIDGGAGTMDLSRVLAGDAEIESSQGGSVDIALPADSDVDVDLTCDVGEVHTDFDLAKGDDRPIGGSFSGRIGRGGSRLSVRSRVGQIHLRRLAADLPAATLAPPRAAFSTPAPSPVPGETGTPRATPQPATATPAR